MRESTLLSRNPALQKVSNPRLYEGGGWCLISGLDYRELQVEVQLIS